MRLLDLFCGRWGWSRAFAARGWECLGIDWTRPPEIARGCAFFEADVMSLHVTGSGQWWSNDNHLGEFNFIVASSPCEQFSVHGMKHFHPNPPYPELGIKLFNHTRQLCESAGVPYVMENVRAAQQFVGNAVHHCGPFYLWGNGVPPMMPQNINKGTGDQSVKWQRENGLMDKRERARKTATIPIELANCVADYAERILEQRLAHKVST